LLFTSRYVLQSAGFRFAGIYTDIFGGVKQNIGQVVEIYTTPEILLTFGPFSFWPYMKGLGKLFARYPEPSDEESRQWARRRTMLISTIEGAFWAVMAGFGETYIMPFAVFLKAGNRALAFLGTMPTIIGALAQRLGAAWTDRVGRRRGPVVLAVSLQALAFIPLFFVPAPAGRYAVPAVLLFAALGTAAGNLVAPAWLSMMSEVVPAEERGAFFGARSRVVIFTLFAATLAAGGVLAWYQRAGWTMAGFGVLFGTACLARLISARLLALHYDPPYRPTPDEYFSFWDFLRRLPQSNFARFAVFNALMNGAISVASPFFTVYFLRDLHWSYVQFTVNAAAFQAVQFLMVRAWGRMGDRYGNRVVIVITSLLIPIIPFLFALTRNYWWLLVIQMFAGLAWSGFALAGQNFMFDAVSPPKRARIVAYTSILNGAFTLLGGTLLGAWLAERLPARYQFGGLAIDFGSSLPPLFIVSGALRLAAAAMLILAFREVRAVQPIHPALLLLRLSGGEVIAGLIQDAIARLPVARRFSEEKGRRVRDSHRPSE
jgi:MFS family permease